MNPTSIADLLEPLRAPAAIPWWPPAPGWWLLALLCLALLVWLARLAWRFHRRGAPLRAARRELAVIAARTPVTERAAALAALQRRVAIRIAGRRACAGLTGAAWADFLNRLAPGEERFFDATLMEFAYRPAVDEGDCDDALEATSRWLSRLERPA